MTDRDRWIVRNAALAIAGFMVVSVLGGCVTYRYRQPDGGYRSQFDHYAPSRNDMRPFPDHLQQGSYH